MSSRSSVPLALDYAPFLYALFGALLTLIATAFWRHRDVLRTLAEAAREDQIVRKSAFDEALEKLERAVWDMSPVRTHFPMLPGGARRDHPDDSYENWTVAREVFERALVVWRKAWFKTRPDDEEFLDRFRKLGLLLEGAVNLKPLPSGWDATWAIASFTGLMRGAIDDARGRYWRPEENDEASLPPFDRFQELLVESLAASDEGRLFYLFQTYGNHPEWFPHEGEEPAYVLEAVRIDRWRV